MRLTSEFTLKEKLVVELAALALAIVIAHYGYQYLKQKKEPIQISA